ncbi:MAG TPA: GNAT family N-acetyltransferase [Bacteroidales bacterium]|nr:GNAT family N-acetyltransferase [Bacteroidales bacterium]
MIEVVRYPELDDEIKRTLENLIEAEFGHISIVSETEWAKPDWTFICYNNSEIVSFYNIVQRNIIIDNIKVKIAGINNVITPEKFRGNGYASKMLRETEYFIFDDLNSKYGLLLCADELISFYERLNWYKVGCPVHFTQSDGEKVWGANTMLLTKAKKIFPKQIHLNGLPW